MFRKNKDKNIAPKHERNFISLFKFFEKQFPGWISHKEVLNGGGFKFVTEKNLNDLVEKDLLESNESTEFGEAERPEGGKIKTHYKLTRYRLSPNGFVFLTNARSKLTNTILLWLTAITVIFGLIQIFPMIIDFVHWLTSHGIRA